MLPGGGIIRRGLTGPYTEGVCHMTITATRPDIPEVERFFRHDLTFEVDGDMNLKMKAFTSGVLEEGAVLVMLDVDGESRDQVVVADYHNSLGQIGRAIAALTETKATLERLMRS